MRTSVPFYHATTRNLVVAFGGLFGNIFIQTKDTAGVTQKIVKCPISFSNKEKFIVRMQQDPGLNEDTMLVLPRLAFEIVGFNYDPQRQLNKINRTVSTLTDHRVVYSYTPVPYNVAFNLYSLTNTNEDNYQIMEQILPYFSPEMNLSIKMMQNPDLVQDMPMILTSVSTDDNIAGSFESRRYIVTTYTFVMKAYYYAPILNSKDPEKHFDDGPATELIKYVQANVNGQTKYSAIVDPFAAVQGDAYVIREEWTDVNPPSM